MLILVFLYLLTQPADLNQAAARVCENPSLASWQAFADKLATQLPPPRNALTADVTACLESTDIELRYLGQITGTVQACYLSFIANTALDESYLARSLVFMEFRNDRWHAQALQAGVMGDWIMLPSEGLFWRDRLYVHGQLEAGGNWGRVVAEVYENRDGRWIMLQRISPYIEMSKPPKFPQVAGKSLPAPLYPRSRLEPEYVSAAHASLHLTQQHTWILEDGLYKEVGVRVVETPMLALDQILRAIEINDDGLLRSRVSDATVARSVKELPSETLAECAWGNGDLATTLRLGCYMMSFKKVEGRFVLAEVNRP